MKYFNRSFDEQTFLTVFREIHLLYDMEIFVYEYMQWLKLIKPDAEEEMVKRIVVRSIFYHAGYLQYGRTSLNNKQLLDDWSRAVVRVVYNNKIPCVLEDHTPVGRRLETITGD